MLCSALLQLFIPGMVALPRLQRHCRCPQHSCWLPKLLPSTVPTLGDLLSWQPPALLRHPAGADRCLAALYPAPLVGILLLLLLALLRGRADILPAPLGSPFVAPHLCLCLVPYPQSRQGRHHLQSMRGHRLCTSSQDVAAASCFT